MEKEYRTVSVNIEKIHIYYQEKADEVTVSVLLEMPTGEEFTKLQYQNIIRQITARFNNGEYQKINLISLIVSKNVDKVRSFCEEGMNILLVDLNEMRIIRYEDQANGFDVMYKELEEIISKKTMNAYDGPSCGDRVNVNKHSSSQQRKKWNSYKIYNKPGYNHRARVYKKLPFEITNLTLVVINIVIFMVMDLFQLEEKVFSFGALYWPYIKYNNEYYRLITSMFIHGSTDHLINNMLVLLFIGDTLERSVGKIKYLVLYFATGIIAGLVSMSYNMGKGVLVQSVGASGAIFGVVGAVAFLVIVSRGRLKDISTRQIFIFVVLSLYGGLSSQGVDNAAHVGGLIAGVVLSAVLFLFQKRGGEYR